METIRKAHYQETLLRELVGKVGGGRASLVDVRAIIMYMFVRVCGIPTA